MSTITSRKEYLTGRVYCIPIGTVIALGSGDSSLTVSKTTWPDNVPTTNWSDWMIQDTQKITKTKEFGEEVFGVLNDNGGMTDNKEKYLKGVVFSGETFHTREIFKQLEWGLASIPQIGEAQAPFAENEDSIECVCLIEFQDSRTGAMTEAVQFWAKLSLKDDGSGSEKTRKLVYELERVPSGNETYNLLA